MPRIFQQTLQKVEVMIDVKCDICGKSTKADTYEGFERAQIVAAFNETIHAGDRWVVELCHYCFHDFMEWLLIDKLGTCLYHNAAEDDELNPMDETDIDDIRAFFAGRRTERLTESTEESTFE